MSSTGNNRRHFYEFGPFRLSEAEGVLRRGDEVLPLAPRAVDLLQILIKNAGQVLSTEDLLKSIWADCVVESNNLQTQIAAVRRAIGKEFIKTVPKRGYQFTGKVTETSEEPPAPDQDLTRGPLLPMASRSVGGHSTSAAVPTPQAVPGYSKRIAMPVIAAVLSLAGAWFALRGHHLIAPRPSVAATGRLLAGITCEGCRPTEIKLDRMPSEVLINPAGTKVYAIERWSKTMTVVGFSDHAVERILTLPLDAYSAAMARDGKRIYVGSSTDGVMVVDAERDQVLGRIFPTGGPVHSLAVTPGEEKLFLAMGTAGLKRISTGSGDTRLLSEIDSPEFVGIDPSGRELFVSYQHGGPRGRSGHDSLEIYDVESERSVAIVTGPPMVGGPPSFAPGSSLVLLNGQDACAWPVYDHVGCPIVPGTVSHLLRSADRTIVRTIGRQADRLRGETGAASTYVPDGRRLIVTGLSLTVVDVSKQAVLEKYEDPGEFPGQVAFDATGRHAVVPAYPVGLLVLKTLDQPCLPPEEGQFNLYPGDGSFDDVRQVESLVPEGGVEFVPGVIGQAIRLNGKDSMLHARAWAACGDCGDSWTESLFVKFDALQGEMTILERASTGRGPGHRLFKSLDNQINLEIDGNISPRQSVHAGPVIAGSWRHYAVVSNGGELALYIDGTLMGNVPVPKNPNVFNEWWGDVCVGATHQRRARLTGRIDELAFYNRALEAWEINRIYELSRTSSCRQ